MDWASPFLGRHSGSGCFIGPASLLGPSGWAPIFKPHQDQTGIIMHASMKEDEEVSLDGDEE